jgi:predicted HAD superfamily Cof-like phosphohydrolase
MEMSLISPIPKKKTTSLFTLPINCQQANNNDLVEVADALGDMLYILCGTILTHGMQHIIEDVFAEIQDSNMSKLGLDGKPIYREDGKVMKGPNYRRPDLKQFLD